MPKPGSSANSNVPSFALAGHQRTALSLSRTSQEADEENHNAHTLMILVALSLLGAFGIMRGSHWGAQAEEQATTADARSPSTDVTCCKAGDMTPPTELVKKVPKGQLHSPYPDYAKLATSINSGCQDAMSVMAAQVVEGSARP